MWRAKGLIGTEHEGLARRLLADRDFLLAAVDDDYRYERSEGEDDGLLQHADQRFRRDRRVVLAAVARTGRDLQYVAESFKSDKDIVIAAVKQCGLALELADASLKCDNEVVLVAVVQTALRCNSSTRGSSATRRSSWRPTRVGAPDWNALWSRVVVAGDQDVPFADDTARLSFQRGAILRGYRCHYGDAVESNMENFVAADESLRRDRDCLADESLRRDRDFVLAAVAVEGLAVRDADESHALAAVRQNGEADPSLKLDRDVVMAAVKRDDWAIEWARESDPSFFSAVLRQNDWAYRSPKKRAAGSTSRWTFRGVR